MSYICTIGNRVCSTGSTILKMKDYLNPYDLPDRTIRIQSSKALSVSDMIKTEYYENMTCVDNERHIYDIQIRSWVELFATGFIFSHPEDWLVGVIGANASSVGNMSRMFQGCTRLLDVALFDTRSLKHMDQMFEGCTNLLYIQPYNVSQVEYATRAFRNCTNVRTGIVSMYNALSTNGHIQSDGHVEVFYSCGSSNTHGAAELAQIPSDWK